MSDRDPYVVPLDADGNAIGTNHQIHNPTIILKPENLRLAPSARIDSFCKIECGEDTFIGELVHIASFAHIGIGGGKLIIEDRAGVSSGAKIMSGTNVPGRGHGCSAIDPASEIDRSKTTTICADATIFANAVVLPGLTIGANAVLAAGAVATRDIPAREVWAGVPARKIGDLEDAHEVLSAAESAELETRPEDKAATESASEALSGPAPWCILVAGPESSGNHLAMHLLKAMGCHGSTEDVQPFDHRLPFPEEGRHIMWGKSAPSDLTWPDLQGMARRATEAGYAVHGLMPLRGFYPTSVSQVQRGRVPHHRQAKRNMRIALEYISRQFNEAGIEWRWLLYEELIDRGIQVTRILAEDLGLSFDRAAIAELITDENGKHYQRHGEAPADD